MADNVAVRMRKPFRAKFEPYMRSDPGSADGKPKAYVAIAAKIAREFILERIDKKWPAEAVKGAVIIYYLRQLVPRVPGRPEVGCRPF
jgi:hypothetical protein